MQCHVIILWTDTTGTANTFYEIEKRKNTIDERTKATTNRKIKSTVIMGRFPPIGRSAPIGKIAPGCDKNTR